MMKQQHSRIKQETTLRKGLIMTGWGVGLLILLGLVLVATNALNQAFPPPATPTPLPPITEHTVSSVQKVTLLWVKDDIYSHSQSKGNGSSLQAANGTIFVIGGIQKFTDLNLLALDRHDGTLIWQDDPSRSPFSIFATPSSLFVGAVGGIHSRIPETGEESCVSCGLRWEFERPVTYLFAENEFLYAASGGRYIIDIRSNEILEDMVTQVDPEFFKANSLFISDYLIIDQLNSLTISGLDRHSRQTLWEVEIENISNLAATESTVFFLTKDGRLLGLAARTGEIVAEVQFEPAPFITSDHDDPDNPPGGYFVAVDKEEGLVYALLGDSRQLFAFEILAEAE